MNYLTMLMAEELLEITFSISKERDHAIAAAVFDQGGNLLSFKRNESVFLGAISAAIAKAKSANAFRRSTQEMQNRLTDGKLSYLALDQVLPMEGGVPIVVNGVYLGGLGISGAPSEIDHIIALEAVNELARRIESNEPV